MADVELTGETGCAVAVVDTELAPRAIAVGVHRRLGHAELAGDLLRRKVLIDEPEALALARRKKPGRIIDDVRSCAHNPDTKR
jgi:hypothetical protein